MAPVPTNRVTPTTPIKYPTCIIIPRCWTLWSDRIQVDPRWLPIDCHLSLASGSSWTIHWQMSPTNGPLNHSLPGLVKDLVLSTRVNVFSTHGLANDLSHDPSATGLVKGLSKMTTMKLIELHIQCIKSNYSLGAEATISWFYFLLLLHPLRLAWFCVQSDK